MRKRLLSLLLALTLLPGMLVRAEGTEPDFSDLEEGAWYTPYVLRMAAQGVVNGFEDGSFRPGAEVLWGQALKLVVLAAGFSAKKPGEDEHWAEGYRAWAERRDWAVPETEALDEPILRAELAELCAAALELGAPAGDSPYADTEAPAALALYEAGIMEGSVSEGERRFLGETGLRRSEVCAVLCRMTDYVSEHFVFVSGLRAPIRFDLPMSTLNTDSFAVDRHGVVTCADLSLAPRYGIDVSFYQGEIDWPTVASDRVDFAMIRCGFRGYGSEGRLVEDVRFRENLEGALAAGLDVGVYFFSQALNAEEAEEEAAFVLERIAGKRLNMPVVFDWERQTASGSRTADPDWPQITEAAVAFCEAIRAAGYTPMVYFNRHMAYLEYDLSRLTDYDWWLASYGSHPGFLYRCRMWQYGSNGSVKGINGRVDMDIWFDSQPS